MLKAPRTYDKAANSATTALDFEALQPDPETGELIQQRSLTQQQFAKEANINEIVRRFGLTGQLPDGINAPVSGDFTGITSYEEAMRVMRQAQESFMELPADQRQRFHNDPGEMLAFLNDDKNRDEALRLGMIKKPAERTRDVVQAVDELAASLREPPKK